MNLRLASVAIAALISCTASHAGEPPVLVHGTFTYSSDFDTGVTVWIAPDDASLRAIPQQLARKMKGSDGPASFGLGIGSDYGQKVVPKLFSARLGVKIPETLGATYYCQSYEGSGSFVVSALKFVSKYNDRDGQVEYVTAHLDSIRDIRLESKTCGKDGNTHEIKVSEGSRRIETRPDSRSSGGDTPHATAEQGRQVEPRAAQQRQSAQTPARRVPYTTVFRVNRDGSVSPRVPIRFKGISMSGNQSFNRGVSFNGVDFAAMQGHDISVVRNGEWWDIQGFY